MPNVFPKGLVDSVNGLVGRIKLALLKEVTLVGSLISFLDQDGQEIDSINITVDNVEGLTEALEANSGDYLPRDGSLPMTGNLTANSFIKQGSTNDYVLLAGGGIKLLSDFDTISDHQHSWTEITTEDYDLAASYLSQLNF